MNKASRRCIEEMVEFIEAAKERKIYFVKDVDPGCKDAIINIEEDSETISIELESVYIYYLPHICTKDFGLTRLLINKDKRTVELYDRDGEKINITLELKPTEFIYIETVCGNTMSYNICITSLPSHLARCDNSANLLKLFPIVASDDEYEIGNEETYICTDICAYLSPYDVLPRHIIGYKSKIQDYNFHKASCELDRNRIKYIDNTLYLEKGAVLFIQSRKESKPDHVEIVTQTSRYKFITEEYPPDSNATITSYRFYCNLFHMRCDDDDPGAITTIFPKYTVIVAVLKGDQVTIVYPDDVTDNSELADLVKNIALKYRGCVFTDIVYEDLCTLNKFADGITNLFIVDKDSQKVYNINKVAVCRSFLGMSIEDID